MSQVNITRDPAVVDDRGDRSAAAGINMITVLIVLAVLVVLGWFLFTGPLQSVVQPGNTNINVNPPAQQAPAQQAPNVNINPPSAPSGNTGSGSGSTSGGSGSSGSTTNP